MEKVEKDCTRSSEEFSKHYDGCPYAHQLQDVPEDVKTVLSATNVDRRSDLDELRREKGKDQRSHSL